ncbi:MAG TPA: phage tail protein [Candidatus Xenobia bacterium]
MEGALGTNPAQGAGFSNVGAALVGIIAAIQNQGYTYAPDTGMTNAFAVTLTPTPAPYQAGQIVAFKAAHTTTGNCTLTVNGHQPPQNLYKGLNTAIAAGDIVAGQIATAIYDGSNFQLASVSGAGTITLTGDVTGSGTGTIPTTINNTVSAGTFPKVTVNSKGLVTAGSQLSVTTQTTSYTLVATDDVVLGNATSAAITLTLPSAAGITGKTYSMKKIDPTGNAVTIATTGSQTIDGSTTQVLAAQYQEMMVVSNGTSWYIVSQAGAASSVPAGIVMAWPTATAPAGWLICNGSTYNISAYPNLYNVIGHTYGGNTTTFAVPNLGGQVIIGAGNSAHGGGGPYTLNQPYGSAYLTLTAAQLPSHSHTIETSLNVSGGASAYGLGSTYPNSSTQATGSGTPVFMLQPSWPLNYIIKT